MTKATKTKSIKKTKNTELEVITKPSKAYLDALKAVTEMEKSVPHKISPQ